MERPGVTAKDFFLWFGAMIAFYWTIIAFVSLLFSYLNYALPDALQYYSGDPYSAGMSYQMASLVVMFPLYLLLMRIIRRSIEGDSSRADVWVRRWALVLTLFIAGIALAADLVTLLQYFFNGDVTLRFALKVLVVLLVAGGVFLHFLADLKGYWIAFPSRARMVGWGVALLVAASIVAGFFIVGTPMQARLYRYDDQKVSDLQNIQYQIVNWWQAKQALPASLAMLNDSISGFTVPNDPQTGAAYEYRTTGTAAFELCASFNAETQPFSPYARAIPVIPSGAAQKTDTWQHGAGHTCFARTIDPALYPPLTK